MIQRFRIPIYSEVQRKYIYLYWNPSLYGKEVNFAYVYCICICILLGILLTFGGRIHLVTTSWEEGRKTRPFASLNSKCIVDAKAITTSSFLALEDNGNVYYCDFLIGGK